MPKTNRLANIENGLEIGYPTRDDLHKKIALEATKVVNSVSEDDLTSFSPEAELKFKIRDELYEISMTDEMVQALYVADNVLDDVYRFCLDADKADQVFMAVFEYLEKVEHDYLAEKVFDHVKLEYDSYLNEVKKMTPEKIVEEMFTLTSIYDLHISLEPETSNVSTERLRALNSLVSPLWDLYDEWMNHDCTYMDDMKDVIQDVADKRTAENEWNKVEIDYDHFDVGEQEDEDEQEP